MLSDLRITGDVHMECDPLDMMLSFRSSYFGIELFIIYFYQLQN